MLNLLKKIYVQDEFTIQEDTVDNVLFSSRENKEYYITVHYTKKELEKFYDSEKSNNIITLFNKLKTDKSDIEKNTSLIICLKIENLNEINVTLKNIIFSIEEDGYFFRKYVIIYTQGSMQNIDINDNIEKQLHEIIKKDDMMKEYQKNSYFSEEFFLAMQLFVKLPFLVYEGGVEQFITVEEELEKIIEMKKLNGIYNKVINCNEELSYDKSEYISKLTDEFLSEKNDSNILSDFFNYFEVIE